MAWFSLATMTCNFAHFMEFCGAFVVENSGYGDFWTNILEIYILFGILIKLFAFILKYDVYRIHSLE